MALLRQGAEGYSVPIVAELGERTGREVSPAAVYIALRRLEEKGLLVSELRSAHRDDAFMSHLAGERPDLVVRSDGSLRETRLIPLQIATAREVAGSLVLLMWAVLLMLAIACANVANLLGIYNLLPNIALQKAIYANLEQVGGVLYDDREWAFADLLRKTLPEDAPPLERAAQIEPFTVTEEGSGGSTDVADVSWVVPTGGMHAATWVPGTAAHSWQAVAAGGTTIGEKGLVVAAKTLAMTAVDLFTNPALVAEVKAERLSRVGPDFV